MTTWTHCRHLALACCLWFAASPTPGQAWEETPGQAWEETPGQAWEAGRPGGSYRGRYIGFVPMHERLPELPKLPPPDGVEVAAPAGGMPLDGAALASYEQAWDERSAGEECSSCGVSCDGSCGVTPGLPACGPVYAAPLIWGRADYLSWWTRGMTTPALATASAEDTPQERAGVLGDPNTSVLFGSTDVNDESRSGGRVTIGRWLDPAFCHGFDVTYLWLAEGSDRFFGSGDDLAILARPFFNTQTGEQDSRLIVFPELVDGALTIRSATDFQSWEAVLRRSVAQWADVQTDYFLGYRYAELEDLLQVDEATVSLGGPTAGSSFDLFDRIGARNRFHGGQFGIRVVRQANPLWSIELTGQVALGGTSSTVVLEGETVATTSDDQSETTDSGLLVQSTNRGTYEHDTFSTLSEVGITLRRQFACGLAARFGYTFLYWSDVLRAGEQLDLSVNTSQIPPGTLEGERRPAVPLDTAGFWAQGMHFGFDYRY